MLLHKRILAGKNHLSIALVAVFISILLATAFPTTLGNAEAADLSATQLYVQAGKALIPNLDQFRVTVKATKDGRMLFNSIIGWNKGWLLSASVQTPGARGYTDYALRPSGFMLKKADGKEQVHADLLAKADFLAMIPRIVNQDVWQEALGILGADAQITGTKKVAGRNTNVLNAKTSTDTYKKAAQFVVDRIMADPGALSFVSWLAEQQRKSPENAALWLRDFPAQTAKLLTVLPLPPTPVNIETTNGTIIGVDTTGWSSWWKEKGSRLEPFFYQPKLTISGVRTDRAGNITSLFARLIIYQGIRINYDRIQERVTDQDKEVLSKAKILQTIDVDMRRVGNSLLPSVINYKTSYDLGPDWRVIPGQDEHNLRITFSWDLGKSADTKLTEAPALVETERAWQAAQAAIAGGNQATAIAELEKVARLAPAFRDAHYLLASLYRDAGQQDNYTRALDRLLQGTPDDAKALSELAYVLVDKKLDVSRGLELAKKAYQLDGVDPSVAHTLGWAYYRNGMLDDAVILLQYAININRAESGAPNRGVYQYRLALALYEQRKYEEALAAVDAALEAEPGMAEAVELRAKVLEAQR